MPLWHALCREYRERDKVCLSGVPCGPFPYPPLRSVPPDVPPGLCAAASVPRAAGVTEQGRRAEPMGQPVAGCQVCGRWQPWCKRRRKSHGRRGWGLSQKLGLSVPRHVQRPCVWPGTGHPGQPAGPASGGASHAQPERGGWDERVRKGALTCSQDACHAAAPSCSFLFFPASGVGSLTSSISISSHSWVFVRIHCTRQGRAECICNSSSHHKFLCNYGAVTTVAGARTTRLSTGS